MLWRDPWVAMGALAMRTSRITIGTNVTNTKTRDLTVTASAAATTEEVARKRFILGIGTGDSSVRIIGERPTRLDEMRAYISEFRALVAGQDVQRGGRDMRMRPGTRNPIPIYLSAIGPKALQLAGEIADGVITYGGTARSSLESIRSSLEAGAQRAGRRAAAIDIVNGLFSYVGDDWRSARKLAQPHAARHAIRHPDSMAAYGIDLPSLESYSERLYPDLVHAEDWDRAIELTNWIPDDYLAWFCDSYCLIGTADDVAAKVRTMEGTGIGQLYVHNFYSYQMPNQLVESFGTQLLPRLAPRREA
jgi:5,10-methylenetetrahydromethanopterin reductase